jgi:cobalt/nickel transport system permease protein
MADMHIPDGFFDAQTSIAGVVLAAGAVAGSLRRARAELAEAAAPLAGLVAVFVFAGQMINFPVGAGTSGHLLGAALAAILVGPATAVLVMTVVLTVQALVFADGGLTALGLNVLNLAVIAPIAAYLVFRLAARVLPRTRGGTLMAAFAAGWVSVIASAAAFSLEFAIGGTTAIEPATVAVAMLAVHAVIGAVEGVITALIVGSVAGLRPDLVYGLRRSAEPPIAASDAAPAGV